MTSTKAIDSTAPRKINRIVVLGGGTAGFLAALALAKHLPEIAVSVVRSTKMGVIGVGEGTIWSVVNFLHQFLEIDPVDFHRKANPSIKLGIHYFWGKRPFFNYTFAPQLTAPLHGSNLARGYFCEEDFSYAGLPGALMAHDKVCLKKPNGDPQLPGSYAYHLENKTFVAFLEDLAQASGLETLDDVVSGVEQSEQGIEALRLESGRKVRGDLFVDCSGFRAELIGQALEEEFVDFNNVLFCDRAIFGGWERTSGDAYHPYTTAETMNAGWSWRIEHDHAVNRGYVYSSTFLSEEAADAEFKQRNPQVKKTLGVKFRPGVRRRTWVKNVVALGNAAGFVEPLEATAIGMICDGTVSLVRALTSSGGTLADASRDAYNRLQTTNWEIIRDFLAIHYKFNDRLPTPFWHACIHDTPLGGAQKYVDYYQEVGPDFSLLNTDLKRDFFSAEGYLSMLVGQQVPFRRQVRFSVKDRHAWKLARDALRDSMFNAMDMAEYLAYVRGGDLGKSSSPVSTHADSPYLGESALLRWH